jgi:cytochrome c-type biogenesis protein CcmH
VTGLRRILPAVVAALTLVFAVPAGAHPGDHRTTMSEIEDEVKCPTCGTTLQLAQSPLADRHRAMISKLVERNWTKEQIKAALVREFGEEVLATPPRRGFSLSAYAIPALVLVGVAASLPFAILRWRRSTSRADDHTPEFDSFDDPEAARLDAELARRG